MHDLVDGKNFVFTLNGKERTGVLSQEGDKYILNYDDTSKKMEAYIDGDILYMKIVGGKSSFEFKAK